MRNISSWGMNQFEIFHEKIIFFQNNVPLKALGSRR